MFQPILCDMQLFMTLKTMNESFISAYHTEKNLEKNLKFYLVQWLVVAVEDDVYESYRRVYQKEK